MDRRLDSSLPAEALINRPAMPTTSLPERVSCGLRANPSIWSQKARTGGRPRKTKKTAGFARCHSKQRNTAHGGVPADYCFLRRWENWARRVVRTGAEGVEIVELGFFNTPRLGCPDLNRAVTIRDPVHRPDLRCRGCLPLLMPTSFRPRTKQARKPGFNKRGRGEATK